MSIYDPNQQPGQGDDPDQSNESNNPQDQQKGGQYTPPNRGESAPSGHLGENNLAVERRYGLSISDEDRKKSFEIEDARWSTANQLKDWGKLGIMVLITVIWCLTIYLLEPGLR